MFHSHVGCSSDRGSIKYTHFHVSRWYACRRIIAVSENTVLVRKVWRWGWCYADDVITRKNFVTKKKTVVRKAPFLLSQRWIPVYAVAFMHRIVRSWDLLHFIFSGTKRTNPVPFLYLVSWALVQGTYKFSEFFFNNINTWIVHDAAEYLILIVFSRTRLLHSS